MAPRSGDERQLARLLSMSEIDIVGDVTAVARTPADLLVWAHALPDPTISLWRAAHSGDRFVQMTADHHAYPVHGTISAVLCAEQHRSFWQALLPDRPDHDLAPGDHQPVRLTLLTQAALSAEDDNDPNSADSPATLE